ncbi:NAD(P)-binding protein [Parathielavia appendiculata]|uniref:Dehydrogenase FUB6 n=1 Tax=Parathielavia appendiculata TaxID=2587402 RepID=A0AAN6TPG3_9PEZI|nr:NAD(P)-binding protein [Parathielavia appendiculata]
MAPVQNKTLIFKEIPTAAPVPGEHLVLEDRGFDPEAAPPQGGLTLSILYASFDPYMRGRMRPAHVESYVPAFELNGPVTSHCVACVIKSDTDAYQPGDLLVGMLPIGEYTVLDREGVKMISRKVDNKYGLKDLGLFIGPLGMTGLTAWSALYEIGQLKKGETIFISSAAGAVGQVAGQIAKRQGLKVIGSVGSDDKLEFIINELGFDSGFNYKKEKPRDALKRLAPEGLDIYYENVGGEQLEAALDAMNNWGRIVVCGMISQYNLSEQDRYGVKNLFHVASKRLTMRGFIVSDFADKYGKDHQERLSQWLAEGSVKAKLSVTDGMDNAIDGLVGMLEGKNFGKAVLKIKDE